MATAAAAAAAAHRALSRRIRPRASITGGISGIGRRALCSAPAPVVAAADASTDSSASGSSRLEELKSRLRTGAVPSLQDFVQQQQQPSRPQQHQPQQQRPPVVVTRNHHQPQRRSASSAALVEEEDEEQVEEQVASPSPASSPLTDSFGRRHTYLRISLTERCNLRCTYCMPADGVPLQAPERLLQSEEILRLAEVFVAHGVTKIRLTGGEPLIRKDVVELTRALKALPGLEELAVTTNGVSPWAKLEALVQAGMTHFNVSLDTLKPERFANISRRPAKYMDLVLANVDRLVTPAAEGGAGLGGRVKLNNVIMRGVNDDELGDFVALTRDRPLDVRFIEWMPFDSNGWNGGTFVAYLEMIERLRDRFPTFARDVDGANDTTKWYRVPGHKGRVGFITSMSQHFCGACNRLRVTADGKLKVCLFGAEDLSLRDALRAGKSKEELTALIGRAVGKKKFSLGGQQDMFALAKSKNRPMILIGG